MNIKSSMLPYICISMLSVLSGCGGETTDDIKEIITQPDENLPDTTQPNENTEQQPTPDTTPSENPPSVGIIDEPGGTPPGDGEEPGDTLPGDGEEPKKGIDELKTDAPIIALPLTTFIASTHRTDSQLTVNWTDAGATSYRVLFWEADGTLHEWLTVQNSQVISSPHSIVAGEIIVEAYDALGNSIFSTPVSMEAL